MSSTVLLLIIIDTDSSTGPSGAKQSEKTDIRFFQVQRLSSAVVEKYQRCSYTLESLSHLVHVSCGRLTSEMMTQPTKAPATQTPLIFRNVTNGAVNPFYGPRTTTKYSSSKERRNMLIQKTCFLSYLITSTVGMAV